MASTVRNIGLHVGGIASSNCTDDTNRSQEIPTGLPMSEIETTDKRVDSEREMKTDVSRRTINGSRLFTFFRKKRKTSKRNWKACDIVVLAMAIIATVSIHAIPTIIYLIRQVRGKVMIVLTIKAFDEHIVKGVNACTVMYSSMCVHVYLLIF